MGWYSAMTILCFPLTTGLPLEKDCGATRAAPYVVRKNYAVSWEFS